MQKSLPAPCAASYIFTYSRARFWPDGASGNWAETMTGLAGTNPPSTSLPPTRRKSLLATP